MTRASVAGGQPTFVGYSQYYKAKSVPGKVGGLGLPLGSTPPTLWAVEPESASIPVRSHRQALDWSLVLASQGLEPAIEYSEEEGGWRLVVPAHDYAAAMTALHLYQRENRRQPWQRELFQPGLLFDWASLPWALLLCLFYWLSGVQPALRSLGVMDGSAVLQGQWWRLFTAVWLHADPAHLAANVTLGFVLLGLTMGSYGTGLGLAAAYLGAAGGNVFAMLLAQGPHRSLGASGMVMAALGLLAVQSLVHWGEHPQARKLILSGLLGGVLLFVLLGVAPGTDILAHLGGFLSGLVLGALLTLFPRSPHRLAVNLLSGLFFTLLVLWPWWLALRSGPKP